MARVRLVTTAEAAAEIRPILERQERDGGEVLNLHRALANAPGALRNFMRLGNSLLFHGVLPPRLRELAILRVAQLTGASYEWAHHLPIALRTGVTEAEVEALGGWESGPLFGAAERAVLRYVDDVTLRVRVSAAAFDALRAHLSEGQVVELTMVAGYWGMVARLLEALEVDVEPAFQKYAPN